jgi:thiol-disulfide isomerase/thioredoxin
MRCVFLRPITQILTVALWGWLVSMASQSTAQKKPEHIVWLTSYADARQQALREEKLLFVYFFAGNSSGCQKMEAETFSDLRVEALSQQMVCVRIDVSKGEGPALVKKFQITSVVSVLFALPGKEVVSSFEGFHSPVDCAAEMVHALIKQSERPDFARNQPITPVVWHVLLVVIRDTNVTVQQNGQSVAYQDTLTDQEIERARQSFFAMPGLAARLTQNRVKIDPKWIVLQAAVTKVSDAGSSMLYPSASDIYPLIESFDKSGEWDTIAVFWKGSKIMHAFGLGGMMTPKGSTYLVVAEASPYAWTGGQGGEIFLHEWTHGVATFFRRLGYADRIPPKDADGGEAYGYKNTPYDGWCTYYLPLFNALVPFEGELRGFDAEMWQRGAARHDARHKVNAASLIDRTTEEIAAILGKPMDRTVSTDTLLHHDYHVEADMPMDISVTYLDGHARTLRIHFVTSDMTCEQCLAQIGIAPPKPGSHQDGTRIATEVPKSVPNQLFWNGLERPFPFKQMSVLMGDGSKPFSVATKSYAVGITLVSQLEKQ